MQHFRLAVPLVAALALPLVPACSNEDPLDTPAPTPASMEPDAEGWVSYGAGFEAAGPVTVAEALEADAGAELVVAGTAETVCQASGCWVIVASGERSARIELRNADGSIFSIPTDGAGSELVARVEVERTGDGVTLVADGAKLRPGSSPP